MLSCRGYQWYDDTLGIKLALELNENGMMGNHFLKIADFETLQKCKALLFVLTDDRLSET